MIRRGRGYKNLRYLLIKVQRMAATKTEFVVVQKASTGRYRFLLRALFRASSGESVGNSASWGALRLEEAA